MNKNWLICDHVGYSTSGKEILFPLSGEVRSSHRCVVLMGSSGSGKTTLVRCLLGLIQPTSGHCSLLGHQFNNVAQSRNMYKRLGVLFQYAALIPDLSVRENLLFPLNIQNIQCDEANQRVHDVLENFDLSHAIDTMPQELSGGMQQRAGLARAMVTSPELLVLDEPLSAQDIQRVQQIEKLFKDYLMNPDKKILMISHDPELAMRIADEIWILYQGRLIATLTPEQVASSNDPRVQSIMMRSVS